MTTIHRFPFKRLLLAGCMVSSLLPARGEDGPPLAELLRDALYAEEVRRDPEQAAALYAELLARFEQDRRFAASALFRLAEVRRKQERRDEAIAAYRQLLARFPDAEPEARLARENLAALGGELPTAAEVASADPEAAELARLQALAQTSPDLLAKPDTLAPALKHGWLRVIEWALQQNPKPDLNPEQNAMLPVAAETGNLELCKQLIRHGADPKKGENRYALQLAVGIGYGQVAEFLLQSGAPPDGEGASPIVQAIDKDSDALTRLLLRYGANPNATRVDRSRRSPVTRTLLSEALGRERTAIAKTLLEAGASAKDPADLQLAIPLGDPTLVQQMLEAGADPNGQLPGREGPTPLGMAVGSGQSQIVDLLLRAGADPNLPMPVLLPLAAHQNRNLELAQALLSHGAEVNRKGVAIHSHGRKGEDTALIRALEGGAYDLASLLLEHGADPNLTVKIPAGENTTDLVDKSPVQAAAAQGDRANDLIDLLIRHGGKPDRAWLERGFASDDSNASIDYEIRRKLTETFLLPTLTGFQGVMLVIHSPFKTATIHLARKGERAQVPALEQLLLHPPEEIQWPLWGSGEQVRRPERAILHRKTSDGSGFSILPPFPLFGETPLPALQWGDIVELDHPYIRNENTIYERLTGERIYSLRRHLSFPISVEIDGKPREIILSGRRLVHDPTRSELPLASAWAVIQTFYQADLPPFQQRRGLLPEIVINREGWPEIRFALESSEASRFPLEAGDHLRLDPPPPFPESSPEWRSAYVSLISPGLPFALHFPMQPIIGEGMLPPPSLLPFLAWAYTPINRSINRSEDLPTKEELAAGGASRLFPLFQAFNGRIPSFLPHPDFSRIRILRLAEDGAEKAIEVNLARVIDGVSGSTSLAEIRAIDLPLQAGDRVELPVLPGRAEQSWEGFSEREAAFFARALQGQVQVFDHSSNLSLKQISFVRQWVHTEAGDVLLPSKNPSGAEDVIAANWLGRDNQASSVTVTRDGMTYNGSPRQTVLREGDQLRLPNQPQLHQPRPRVTPPPADNR